jgi:hypothetical protein
VHRLTEALDRLLGLYRDERESPEESLGAFFRRVPPARATAVLSDLAELVPTAMTDVDYVDLGEDRAFSPEVMDGECAS